MRLRFGGNFLPVERLPEMFGVKTPRSAFMIDNETEAMMSPATGAVCALWLKFRDGRTAVAVPCGRPVEGMVTTRARPLPLPVALAEVREVRVGRVRKSSEFHGAFICERLSVGDPERGGFIAPPSQQWSAWSWSAPVSVSKAAALQPLAHHHSLLETNKEELAPQSFLNDWQLR